MQHISSTSQRSIHSIKRAIITKKRTIIPDDMMEKKLIGYEKKIESGKDFDIQLFNCSFELKSLDTIQPLIKSRVIERVISDYDKFNDQQKLKVLPILHAASVTPYKNVIVLNNLEELMKILKLSYDETTQEKVLLTLKEYLVLDESITEKILKLGGVELILESAKSKSVDVLYQCSTIILYIVLFGGKASVHILLKHDLASWLLPFVGIRDDRRISYYAYFVLVYLRSILRIRHEFFDSGLMDNIVQWLSENEIELRSSASFNYENTLNLHQKLLSMLTSKNRMAQTFGTFQICCELSSNIDGFLIFNDEKIVRALRRIAVYSNMITSKFAINALIILTNISDNRIQRFPPKSITEWNEEDVQKWLKIFDFHDYALFFIGIDGEALMKISDYDLKIHYFIVDEAKRKTFIEERSILSGESSMKTIKSLNEESIFYQSEVTMNNGMAITCDQKSTLIDTPFNKKIHKYDAFISYRRQGGSDLASLIFMHLKAKKHRVFFDVQTLRAGKFADKLKTSIQQSKNFIILLTKDALNRCKDEGDWIAIEIEMALKSNCNIIPVTKDFDNSAFDTVPENIRQIKEFNQIPWHHDTQESCIAKIFEYMEAREKSCYNLIEKLL